MIHFFYHKNTQHLIGIDENGKVVPYEYIGSGAKETHIAQAEVQEPDLPQHKSKPAGGGKTRRACGVCGKPGHRRDSCTTGTDEEELDMPSGPKTTVKDAMLSVDREKFSSVKKLQDMEYTAKEASEASGIFMTLVNRIYTFRDFEDFQDSI